MGNPTTVNTSVFLAGNVLIPRTLLESWEPVLTYLLPLSSEAVNQQFEACLTQIQSLLNATPPVSLNPDLIQIPIQLVVNMQNGTSNFEHQYGGPFQREDYGIMTNNLDSVYNQYSRFFYDSLPGSVLYYNNGG